MDIPKMEASIEEKKGRAKHILDTAVSEKRELSESENREYDTLYGEIAATRSFIDEAKNEELEELRAKIAETPSKPVVQTPKGNFADTLRNLRAEQTLIIPNPELRDWTSASGTDDLVQTDWYNEVVRIRNVNGQARESGMRVIRTNHTQNMPVFTTYGTAATKAEMTAYNESDASFNKVVMGALKVNCGLLAA